jgi:SAM-dependent methyltransferase
MKKVNLNIGCGISIAPGFINIDGFTTLKKIKELYKKEKIKFPKETKFVQTKVQNLPFKDNYADYIESIDMIEHLPMKELTKAFSEMYRVLKPGGLLRIVTTSFDDVVKSWLDASRELTEKVTRGENISEVFDETYSTTGNNGWIDMARKKVNLAMMVIYGNQSHEGEYHMNAFTPAIMFVYLSKCGFTKDNIKIMIHEKGTLAPSFPGSTVLETLKLALINDVIVIEAVK